MAEIQHAVADTTDTTTAATTATTIAATAPLTFWFSNHKSSPPLGAIEKMNLDLDEQIKLIREQYPGMDN